MNKPTGKFKCVVCGQVWDGSQLYQDEQSTVVVWTCGDLTCGGRVVEKKLSSIGWMGNVNGPGADPDVAE